MTHWLPRGTRFATRPASIAARTASRRAWSPRETPPPADGAPPGHTAEDEGRGRHARPHDRDADERGDAHVLGAAQRAAQDHVRPRRAPGTPPRSRAACARHVRDRSSSVKSARDGPAGHGEDDAPARHERHRDDQRRARRPVRLGQRAAPERLAHQHARGLRDGGPGQERHPDDGQRDLVRGDLLGAQRSRARP